MCRVLKGRAGQRQYHKQPLPGTWKAVVLPHSTVGIRIRSTVFSPDIVTILYIILADETYILVLVMVRVCSWFDFPSFSVCLPFGTTIPHSCCWGQFQSSLTYRQPLVIGPSSNGMMVET